MNTGDPSSRLVRRTIVQPNLRRRGAGLAVLVAAVLLLAACGDDTKTKAGSATTTGDGGTTTTTEAVAAAAPVATTSNPTLGVILVDTKGMTVYVFDSDKNGTIACVGACTSAWPPVVLEAGNSLPKTGPLAADLSAVARSDGAQQVAYKGRPVYRFSGDAKPGDIKGDGVGGIWHAVKVSAAGGGSTTATTAARVSPY